MTALLPSATPLEFLPDIHTRVWDELVGACTQRGHPWRSATLATLGSDGLPDARTVVLRQADPSAAELLFYTDARSPKVAQMQACPQGMLVLWSAALGWQLRLKVTLTVEMTGLAVSSRWARLKMTPAAQDYLSPLPPGSVLPQPRSGTGLMDHREHFAVVSAQVQDIDWLDLHPDGHRRARFVTGQPGCWLQP